MERACPSRCCSKASPEDLWYIAVSLSLRLDHLLFESKIQKKLFSKTDKQTLQEAALLLVVPKHPLKISSTLLHLVTLSIS